MWYRALGVPSYGASASFIKESDEFAHGLNERIPLLNVRPGVTYYLTRADRSRFEIGDWRIDSPRDRRLWLRRHRANGAPQLYASSTWPGIDSQYFAIFTGSVNVTGSVTTIS